MNATFVTNAIGTAAAAISISSFVPQILDMIKTKDVSGVSLRTYAFTVVSFSLWIAYGWRLGSWPVAVANAAALIMAAIVLTLKWRFGRRPSTQSD